MTKDAKQEQFEIDTDADRFPTIRKALHAIAEEAAAVEGQPEHLELHFLASGECTWRMWLRDAEEPVGNVLTVG